MGELQEQKKQLRKRIKARAAALSPEYRAAADRLIRDEVRGSEAWKCAEAVFLYVSMWAEPDTRALLEAAFAEGKTVYVPRCYPGRIMKAVRIDSLAALQPRTLGIPEPVDDSVTAAPGELDLAIVPCLCASCDGRRLGHGAGYYDRFLAAQKCPTMCICYAELLEDMIPIEAFDIRMDAVVTEDGIYIS